MADQLGHVVDGVDGGAVGQGGLGGVFLRDVQGLQPLPLGGQGHGQHARAGPELAGQGQLAHKGAGALPQAELSAGAQQPHQDGQVIQGADFFHMGGGQIHRDSADGEAEALVLDGRPDPLPGLVDGGVGQAHHGEGGQAVGQVALHRHGVARHAVESQGVDGIDHAELLLILSFAVLHKSRGPLPL